MELIAPGVPATQVFGDLIGAPRAAKPSCNLAEAIGFLKLLDAGGRHNLVAIDPATRQIMGRTFEPGDWPSIGNWICEHSGRRNLYLTVNEPVSGAPHDKLKKEHIGALRAVFADLDPQGKAALETERAEIASKVETLQCSVAPPTVSIDSGGGAQMFWIFADKQSVDQAEWAEDQGRAFRHMIGGDAVQNIDRIMRLPGTLNIPDAGKLAKGRVPRMAAVTHQMARKYSLADLRSVIAPVAAGSTEPTDNSSTFRTSPRTRQSRTCRPSCGRNSTPLASTIPSWRICGGATRQRC
jgi:hypothetical protein